MLVRRGFVVAMSVFVLLAVLALGAGSDGKDNAPGQRTGGEVLPAKAEAVPGPSQQMQKLRNALAPLLIYVENGQPRDALRALAGGSGTGDVSPAALASIHVSMTEAVSNLGSLEGADASEQIQRVRAAAGLYVEAAGLATRAAELGATSEGNAALAAHGLDLLRLGDALFDQARRLDPSTARSASFEYLDEAEAVPEFPSMSGARGSLLGDMGSDADPVATASRCLAGAALDAAIPDAGCADRLLVATAAEETLRHVPENERVIGKRLALSVWMQAESLASDSSRFQLTDDSDLAKRLLSSARTLFTLSDTL